MRDRKQKVKLLTELSKGKRSISELLPATLPIIFMQSKENPDLFCEPSVFRGEPGKCYTKAEFEEMKRKKPSEYISITLNLGDIKIKNSEGEVEL